MSENIKIDANPLDSVISAEVNNTIIKYGSETYTNNTLGYSLLIVFVVIVIALLIYQLILLYKNNWKVSRDIKRNFLWVSVWIISSSILFGSLYWLGLIHSPNTNGFFVSDADILLAVVSIIAIVGAFWAVLARIDAERAFNKSQETLNALGSTFEFFDILNNDKLVDIIKSIGNKNTRINLFLGFPIIGYLFKDKDKLRNQPLKIFGEFNDKLTVLHTALLTGNIEGFHLNLAVFTKDNSEKLLEKNANGTPKPMLLGDRDVLKEFYTNITRLKAIENKQNIKITDIDCNENLRFASIQLEDQPTQNSKAIVWIVRDLTGGVKQFDSAAFQTSDTKLISVLESAFL